MKNTDEIELGGLNDGKQIETFNLVLWDICVALHLILQQAYLTVTVYLRTLESATFCVCSPCTVQDCLGYTGIKWCHAPSRPSSQYFFTMLIRILETGCLVIQKCLVKSYWLSMGLNLLYGTSDHVIAQLWIFCLWSMNCINSVSPASTLCL